MRTSALAFLFCLTSSIVNAEAFQTNKPVICDSTKTVVNFLKDSFNENPVWVAKDQSDKSRYVLFVNSKTGSWTMIQMTPEIACVIGVGVESKMILGTGI